MHLLIPYASARSDDGLAALHGLNTPHLSALLALMGPQATVYGDDEYNPLLPHERLLAAERGLDPAAASLPSAAWQLADPGDLAWAQLTPLHLSVGSDQVTALSPELLQLDEAESRAFFAALTTELFPSAEGWRCQWRAPSLWLIGHESLQGLATASLERVLNRNVDSWMPEARLLRRLQNELQMLLHGHPLNTAREARGALVLNSVWISGCGRAEGQALPAELRVVDTLREPWLAGDWAAWAEAWAAIDAGPLADLHRALRGAAPGTVRLSLAGERQARSWTNQRHGALQRLWHQLAPPRAAVAAPLEAL
ncbi:hypothetical protein RQP53_14550 [Paucibacter sp. APW11]|uniref:Phosphoglycerate mutase n=1 Tax=Roseateles aquae TaxID=3077235 RepID=A0ABU3PD29_9BURK|nr:hypothetical protein [Paucibacter sp. APW11]MDT9000490.1 hypothetical protein [Paucibacter sp. APW11]